MVAEYCSFTHSGTHERLTYSRVHNEKENSMPHVDALPYEYTNHVSDHQINYESYFE